MMFLIGVIAGMVLTLGLIGVLVYGLLSGPGRQVLIKMLNALSQALTPPEPLSVDGAPGLNGAAMERSAEKQSAG